MILISRRARRRATSRVWIALFLTWGWALSCSAQVLVSPSLQETKVQEAAAAEPKVVAVHAAAEPDPALRYRLWPAPADRRNENPAPFVSRAIILELQWAKFEQSRQEFADRYDEWSKMPLEKLPSEEVNRFVDRSAGTALRELARAENLMQIDYDLQLDDLSAAELVATLLPEYQEMRQLARLLQLRARAALAEKRWNDAIDDLRLGFRLAEFAGRSTEFLIGRLVGFAISSMMLDAVADAITQPDCPNLYWALASLPGERLFETRESIEYESVLPSRLFADLGSLPDEPMGADEARRRIKQLADQAILTMAFSANGGGNEFTAEMISGLYVVAMADASRELLATSTAWGASAKELSPSEAVLRAMYFRLTRINDGWVKWTLLPPELWDAYQTEFASAMRSGQPADPLETIVNNLIPSVAAARHAGRRAWQHRNFLMAIEALRMHASTTGELPATLEKLLPVPAWSDPISLKPFGYHRQSSTRATLTRVPRWQDDPETSFLIDLQTKGNQR